jgi:hypothetical protein
VFEMQGHPDIPPRHVAAARFLADFLRPFSRLDGVQLDDMRPVIAELNKILLRHGMRRVRNLLPFGPSLSLESQVD